MADTGTMNFDTNSLDIFNEKTIRGMDLIRNTVDNTKNSYDVLKRNKIFDKGIDRVEKGYEEVELSFKQTMNVFNDYSNELDHIEKEHVDYVNDIKTAKSYALNDVLIAYEEQQANLYKKDGTSINEGEKTTEEQAIDNSTIIAKENLGNINNNGEIDQSKLDEKTTIVKEKLENINDSDQTEEQKYEDAYQVNKEQLEEFDNEKTTEEQKYKDNYSGQKEKLEEIDNEIETENKKLEVDYSIDDEEAKKESVAEIDIENQDSKEEV